MGVRKVLTAKVTFKVIQGHWQAVVPFDRSHAIFIRLPLLPRLCLAPFRDIITYFPKLKEVT